jgi:hypothetical protein
MAGSLRMVKQGADTGIITFQQPMGKSKYLFRQKLSGRASLPLPYLE